jgi:hypothetical protein
MPLTSTQQTTLAADIAADGTLGALPHNSDSADAIATAYAVNASPDFWVWRTSVPAKEIYETTTADATVWSWTAYIARSQAERDAWGAMTMALGVINAALANTRQGIADIFSGTGIAATQRTHLLTVGRRRATRIEKLLATGTGSTASPAVMGFEGALSLNDVLHAWGQ